MLKTSSEMNSFLGALSFISERGILGGIYLGSFCFGFVLANDQIKSDTYPWLAGIFFLLGLIFSNIAYEFLLTPLRWFSEPIVLNSFFKIAPSARQKIKNYNDFRKFRESFLASNNPEHMKSLIYKEEKLRITLTYLLSSNILILIILTIVNQNVLFSKEILYLEKWIAIFSFVATLWGEVSRSQSIGRANGFAYCHQNQNYDSEKTDNSGDIKKKPILCLDFDGVLHWYRKGWTFPTVIDDIPVPGAKEFVESAMKSFDVVVFSSRCRFTGGIESIHGWLTKNNFPEIKIIAEKPSAHVTIDDRAFLFTGQWPEIKDLLEFKPWNKSEVEKNA